MPAENDYILTAKSLSKRFGGVRALDNVDLALRRGEIHAILGENGAGKTTLMNIFGGIIRRDSGSIIFNGEEVDFINPVEAFRKGISAIHQELTMIPHLSVMENIFIGRMHKSGIARGGIVNQKKLVAEACKTLEMIELEIDPGTPVGELSISKQQEIEIVKAVSCNARLIIMDEPNSSLTDTETERLFNVIGKLKEKGVTIVYVSHKIEEVLRIADRITVLRDGRIAGTLLKEGATTSSLFRMIAGREKGGTVTGKSNITGNTLLRVNKLSGRGFTDICFDLHEGEVMGLYGLVGSGRSELGRTIYGADTATDGEIYIEGRKVTVDSPVKAISNGIAMVPEDRKGQALFMNLPVILNMTVSYLKEISFLRFLIRAGKERETINDYISLLNIKVDNADRNVNTLSGGNQQKVVLARYLMLDPKILILDEPTHGIDIGAREEIHNLIRQLASRGVGIIFISSEMPEIISVSDRVAVLHEGELTALFESDQVTEEKLIASATGFITEAV